MNAAKKALNKDGAINESFIDSLKEFIETEIISKIIEAREVVGVAVNDKKGGRSKRQEEPVCEL